MQGFMDNWIPSPIDDAAPPLRDFQSADDDGDGSDGGSGRAEELSEEELLVRLAARSSFTLDELREKSDEFIEKLRQSLSDAPVREELQAAVRELEDAVERTTSTNRAGSDGLPALDDVQVGGVYAQNDAPDQERGRSGNTDDGDDAVEFTENIGLKNGDPSHAG